MILRGAEGAPVAIREGRLVDPSETRGVQTLDVGPGIWWPGLINPHDHLHRNHYPRLGAPPYPDAYAWGRDIHARHADEIARGRAFDRRDALLFGALKNLLAGATTVVHHDPWEAVFERDFPVRVAPVRVLHSLGHERDPVAAAATSGPPDLPLCIHLAEGTRPDDADEVRTLERLDLLHGDLIAVHAVGVDADGIERLRRAGAAVVWCPTSNAFLFGRTAPAALLASGIDVLVGSDSLLTANGTLLDELRAARAHGAFGEAELLDAVGARAARRLGRPPPSLSPGAPADLVLFVRDPLDAEASDVRLVLVDGVPRLGDPDLATVFERAGVETERLRVGAGEKLVQAPLASVARRVVGAFPDTGRIFGSAQSSPGSSRKGAHARPRP